MPLTLEDALIIVKQLVPNGKLIDVQEVVFRGAWLGQTYKQITIAAGYDRGYLKNTGGQLWSLLSAAFGEKVTKGNLLGAFDRYLQKQEQQTAADVPKQVERGEPIFVKTDATTDIAVFYGRVAELSLLANWIQTERCQLIVICGMAGIGKTALAVKLTETVATNFDRVIWISLHNAPPVTELINQILDRLPPTDRARRVGRNVSEKISNLIGLLFRGRYLVVLDHFDAVLKSDMTKDEPNDHLELLKSVGELHHQSCVLVTTREKPAPIAALAGEKLPVRTLALTGLELTAAGELLRDKGLTTEPLFKPLIDNYGGHPLALKVVGAEIQDLFGGNIDLFLEQGTSNFHGLDRCLASQFDRLTPLAQKILYWLAIQQTSIDINELQTETGQGEMRQEMQTALLMLQRKSLVERHTHGFRLHPIVLEFITNILLDRLCTEIIEGTGDLIADYPLMKATAAEYIRERQMRLILAPLNERLVKQLSSAERVRDKVIGLFDSLRERNLHRRGYAIGNCLNLCHYLDIDLTGINLSGASIRQAYLADMNLHNVDCTAAHFQDCRLAQTFGGMTCVTFSPNGELLATCDANGEIQIWQITDHRRLLTLRGHDYWLWSIEFSPDGRHLVTGGQDRTVRLWEIQTGACLYVITLPSIVNQVTFSPDGLLLATSCEDGLIKLWMASTGESLGSLSGHQRSVWTAAFFPDCRTIVSGSEDGTVKLWDVATGNCRQTWHAHHHSVRKVVVSPDGQTVASTSFDLTIRLWDVTTGNCRLTLAGHQDFVVAAAFSPDGQSIATGSYDRTIKLWDVATGNCQQTWEKHTNRIWSVAFHPGGKILASGADDYTVRLWNTQTGRCTQLLQGYSNQILGVAMVGEDLLASGQEDQTIRLWRVGDNQSQCLPYRILAGHANRILSVAFDPGKSRLASSSCDGTIKIWNPLVGNCIQTLYGHQNLVWSVAYSPNSELLASASGDRTVRLWDTTMGVCLHVLQREGTGSVQQVRFSPDGRWLASCGDPHTINLWDCQTAIHWQQLFGHEYRVWSVVWLGVDRLATGDEDGKIRLWEVMTGKCLHTWTAHNCQIFCLDYDPETNRLFSSDARGNLKIWDLVTSKCLATIKAHEHLLLSFCFSSDRRHIHTSSFDGKLKLWDLATLDCLATLIPPRPYEGMEIAGITGVNDAEYSTLIALGASV